MHGFSLGLVFFTLMRRMNCSSTSLCNGFHPLPCLLPHTNLFATVSKICLVFDGTRDWMTDWTGGTGRTDFIHKKRWDERKSNWVLYFSMVSKTSGTNDLSLASTNSPRSITAQQAQVSRCCTVVILGICPIHCQVGCLH